jgi:hypothetical protein
MAAAVMDSTWPPDGDKFLLQPIDCVCSGFGIRLVPVPATGHCYQRWEEFRDCYGDWGRDVAIYLGRQRGRLKLQELAELSGGVGYTAVAQAIRRVRQQIPRDKACGAGSTRSASNCQK